ncbi:hypothetical protein [Oceaniferula spumae]|uniref:hypothetical protein n=1 Tax=Oceaniferula spumae TaxID=2979115 RepID=UPI003F4EF4EE
MNILNHEQGSSTWEKICNTTTGSGSFGDDSERWHDSDSGITIKVKSNLIVSVQANLSRLLTGKIHNGIIVRGQAETAQAITRMWDVLDRISTGLRACEFTSVEFGGVVEIPYTDFELLLKDRNIPRLRKSPLHRRGESIKFGAAKRSQLSLQFYDKGRQLNRHPAWRGASKLEVDRFTRIELKLSGNKLREIMADDVMKDDAGNVVPAPVTKLIHSQWEKKFFEVLYSLAPDDTGKVPLVNDNFITLLAVMAEHDHLRIGGVHVVDLFLSKVSNDRKRRITKAMSVIRCLDQSLRDLIPEDPMPEVIDLVPVPIGAGEVVLKTPR